MDVAEGDAKGLTAEHNGDVSYWWRARGGFPFPSRRPGQHRSRLVRRPRRAPRLVRDGHRGSGIRAGLGWAGGYTGHGVAAANLAGHTLADLVAGHTTDRTALPWVGHRTCRWEPEPLRWAGVHGLYALYRAADHAEGGGSARTSPLARIGDRISGIP